MSTCFYAALFLHHPREAIHGDPRHLIIFINVVLAVLFLAFVPLVWKQLDPATALFTTLLIVVQGAFTWVSLGRYFAARGWGLFRRRRPAHPTPLVRLAARLSHRRQHPPPELTRRPLRPRLLGGVNSSVDVQPVPLDHARLQEKQETDRQTVGLRGAREKAARSG